MRQGRLVVLQPKPPAQLGGAAVITGLFGVLLLVAAFTNQPVAKGFVVWGVLCFLAAGMIAHVGKTRSEVAKNETEAWLAAVQKTTDEYNALEELPEVDCPLSLQKSEVCYWAGEASWYEFRSVTKRINYRGLTASIPIAKGLRYRVGSITPNVERSSELTPIDHGQLYITNKRILFDGGEKNTTLTWGGLTQVQLFDGGVILEKGTGKSPHLMLRERAAEAALTVARHL